MNAKPTIRTTDTAAMRALQQGHAYVIAPMLGQPGIWSVRKEGTLHPYRVDMHAGTCSCPHYQTRCAGNGTDCKHLKMAFLKQAVLQSRPAPEAITTPRTWDLKELTGGWKQR